MLNNIKRRKITFKCKNLIKYIFVQFDITNKIKIQKHFHEF